MLRGPSSAFGGHHDSTLLAFAPLIGLSLLSGCRPMITVLDHANDGAAGSGGHSGGLVAGGGGGQGGSAAPPDPAATLDDTHTLAVEGLGRRVGKNRGDRSPEPAFSSGLWVSEAQSGLPVEYAVVNGGTTRRSNSLLPYDPLCPVDLYRCRDRLCP